MLDAIAIAAQAITGRYLGAGDVAGTREVTRRMVQWGAIGGVVCAVLLAVASPFLGILFTPDPAVRELLVPVLVVAALGQPIAGVVFVLDGVLIGAGDGTYLAWGGLVVLVVYAPVVLWVAVTSAGSSSCGWCSPPSSWGPGWWCWADVRSATRGWSPECRRPRNCSRRRFSST